MATFVSCVVRTHKGINEFVRVEDLIRDGVKPIDGERVVSGRMVPHVITDGPSNSHRITVWTSRGFTIETRYGDNHNRSLEELFSERELEPELEAA